MTTEVLKQKTGRYLRGESVPSEKRQIQMWLSCTADKTEIVSEKEKALIEKEIVAEIHAYIEYTQLGTAPKYWWQKFTTFF